MYLILWGARRLEWQAGADYMDTTALMQVTEALRMVVVPYLDVTAGKRRRNRYERLLFPTLAVPQGSLGYEQSSVLEAFNSGAPIKKRVKMNKEEMWEVCALLRDVLRVMAGRLEACAGTLSGSEGDSRNRPSATILAVVGEVRARIGRQTASIKKGSDKVTEIVGRYNADENIAASWTADVVDPNLAEMHSLLIQWSKSKLLNDDYVYAELKEAGTEVMHTLMVRILGCLKGALGIQGDVLHLPQSTPDEVCPLRVLAPRDVLAGGLG